MQKIARARGVKEDRDHGVAIDIGDVGDDAVAERRVDADQTVVCVITGSGFKDSASVERMTRSSECPVVDSFDEFESAVRADLSRPSFQP